MAQQQQQQPILVLVPPRFSDKQRAMHRRFFQEAGLPMHRIQWRAFHAHKHDASKRRNDNRFTPPTPAERQQILRGIASLNPAMLVVADRTALFVLTGKQSLHLYRGSTYRFRIGAAAGEYSHTVNTVVISDVLNTLPHSKQRWASWIFAEDCRKITRHLSSTQRPQHHFQYEVIRDKDSLVRAVAASKAAIFTSCDVETWGVGDDAHITCVGVGFYTSTGIHSYVFPLHSIDSLPILDPIITRAALNNILGNSTPKVMQNGLYDNAYFLRERLVLNNYWIDTAVIFHSIYQEAPKRLDFLASYALDYVQYWKDETRTAETAASEIEEPYSFPRLAPDVEQYWRYCALDVYYTAAITPFLLAHLRLLPWACENYRRTIRQVVGPALAMNMSGWLVDDKIRQRLMKNMWIENQSALHDLRRMTANSDFNPNSPPQVASLLYDDLGAVPLPKKGRTTGEQILKLIQPQSPILSRIIDQLWATKKPANIVSKYGNKLKLQRSRLYYATSPTGTDTFRYNCRESAYHTGTQMQNPHKDGDVRSFFSADPGYLLVERDYEQSDAYFTAFSADEKRFINDLLSPEDAHCLNASRFFKRPYDTIYQGYRANEEWVCHSTKGVRQITKRIVYGANYRMAAYTLFIQMGFRSIIAAATALGYQGAGRWEVDRCIEFCGFLLQDYFTAVYPGLDPWLRRAIQRAVASGNRAECIGGWSAGGQSTEETARSPATGYTRYFFGNLRSDQKVQREFAAFWGQTGTACNVNDALDRVFYETDEQGNTWLDRGGRLVLQLHDSLITQVPLNALHLVNELSVLMDNERVTPDGQKFKVPGETKVGLGWGRRLIKWPCTLKDVYAHEAKWRSEFFSSH